MTKTEAKKRIHALGMTLGCRDGEYRVNFANGKEATAYYTDDLKDAVMTAQAMKTFRRGFNEDAMLNVEEMINDLRKVGFEVITFE